MSAGAARPTAELFEEAVERSGYSFRCSARDAVWFDGRLKPLLPWLQAELGKDAVADALTGMEMTLGSTDFLSCPDRRERVRARVGVGRLLKQLEARSKR